MREFYAILMPIALLLTMSFTLNLYVNKHIKACWCGILDVQFTSMMGTPFLQKKQGV